MNNKLLPEDIVTLAGVSKIWLSEEDSLLYSKQISAMIDYAVLLRSVVVEGVEPMISPLESSIVMRDDVAIQGLSQEEVLKGSASSEHGHFKVPRTVEG